MWKFQTISEHFHGKRLEKMPKGQIGHSESIQTTLVGKYWKSCKTAKIGHSESIWTTLVGENIGKVAKQSKLVVQNEFGPLW